jgi:hypothetical protein
MDIHYLLQNHILLSLEEILEIEALMTAGF